MHDISQESKQIALPSVAFYGRLRLHFQEMFGIKLDELAGGRILDIASGPSLYPDDIWKKFGVDFTAVDPAYDLDEEVLLRRSNEDAVALTNVYRDSGVLDAILDNKLHKDELLHQTVGFLSSLAREFRQNQIGDGPKYIADELPGIIALADSQYDLVTCGHFLFAYVDSEKRPWLDERFHYDSLSRLTNLSAGEVRVYPTKTLSGNAVPFMGNLIEQLRNDGHTTCFEKVPHSHVKFWDEMLRIIPAHSQSRFNVAHSKKDLWGDTDPWEKVYG